MTNPPSPKSPAADDGAAPAHAKGTKPRRSSQLAANLALLAVVTLVTLGVLDLVLIATGLFPPQVDEGHPVVGWIEAPATGKMEQTACRDLVSGRRVSFSRNEDGVRTSHHSAALREGRELLEIGVGGDSHTELCVPNERAHFGVMELALVADSIPTASFAFGAGKYSPLQAYLAVKPTLESYDADVFVLNLYTGNDFYDMLRVDDRPHFVRSGDGYDIAPPVWYQSDPPGVKRRSRVLYAMRLLSDVTGVRRVWVRVRYLLDAAREQDQGVGAVVSYMADLRRATVPETGYPQAFSAQILNQQLFFHHFPGSAEEGVRRVGALLRRIRAEQPGRLLVVSPIPSYQLVLGEPTDTLLARTVARLSVSFEEGVTLEQRLYDALRAAADSAGWSFVDNLPTLRAQADRSALYNHFDYHVEPAANELIGRNQAELIKRLTPERPRR